MAEIELTFGTAMATIQLDNFALFEEFDTVNKLFNDLEIQCAEYIIGYLISRFAHKYFSLLDSDISDQNKASKWISHISKCNLKYY